jgi:hypothetical protein
MKKAFSPFICLLFVLCSCSHGNINRLWGVWNLAGGKEEYCIPISLGYYATTSGSYVFEPDGRIFRMVARLGGENDYTIKKIITTGNDYYVTVDWFPPASPQNQANTPITGILLVHFINNDTMWIEADYTGNEMNSDFDAAFPESIFRPDKGKEIYWRRAKNKQPNPLSHAPQNTENIWGCWNIGDRAKAIHTDFLSLGYYASTVGSLDFEPYSDLGKSLDFYLKNANQKITTMSLTIPNDQDEFLIEDIHKIRDGYDFTMGHPSQRKAANGKDEGFIVYGEVLMHFIDNAHMWLEVADKDKQPDRFFNDYFPIREFYGKQKIYWRAKEITIPLPDTEN